MSVRKKGDTSTLTCYLSTYIMWKSIAHDDQFGPFSAEHRPATKGEEAAIDMPLAPATEPATATQSRRGPNVAYTGT